MLLPSDINRSRISHAKIVGFSLLYCSIFETTAGVATFGLLPPIKPGGRKVPENENKSLSFFSSEIKQGTIIKRVKFNKICT